MKHSLSIARRTARCALACAGAVSLTVTLPQATSAAPAGNPAPEVTSHAVTLVTGDQVHLTARPGGQHDVAVSRGPGREKIDFIQRAYKARVTVIPSDAVGLLAAGRIDPRLFDITELVRQKVDDASRGDLPLIVTNPAGAQIRQYLPSVNGVAVAADKKTVGAQWPTLSSGKIWLDGKRELLDDESNAQIGVPAAWQAGYKGKGVTVAVLDTGIDAAHADLADSVIESRDFTGTGIADTVGHGTHVAATIAGTGAASAGKYAGVAPEAKLLVGKVCPDTSCPESAILAGMQWAAEQKAKIVSLSLGGPDAAGLDPLEEAVNTLTASSGSLFVIAAGNSGPRAQTVASPGSADAALTVASVNKQDVLSQFSSRGPRVSDAGMKPEIAAPGEAIISARAAGTTMGTPIDDNYTSANGTSMATPHVSGAAAILAQAHPDWTAADIKTALSSTAKPITATSYEQGAGRVDVGRAVTQSVVATATVGFGVLSAPFTSPPVTKQVTYRNNSDAAVTLNLVASSTAPTDAFTVNAAQVTVQAKGQAEVGLTVNVAALASSPFGSYAGRLTSSTQDGSVVAQTVFGAVTEPESFDVNIRFIDRDGNPASAELPQTLAITALEQVAVEPPGLISVRGGHVKLRLAKGQYAFDGRIVTPKAGTPTEIGNATISIKPAVTVDRALDLTFDARTGNRVNFRFDRPNLTRHSTWTVSRYTVDEGGGVFTPTSMWVGIGLVDVYVTPAQADPARFTFGIQAVETSAPGARETLVYNLAFAEPGRVPANVTYRFAERDLARVSARYRAQALPGIIGERADLPDFLPGQNFRTSFYVQVPLPARRTEFYNAAAAFTQFFAQHTPTEPVSLYGLVETGGLRFPAGSRTARDWNSAVVGPQFSAHHGGNGVGRSGNRIIANISVTNPADPGTGGLALLTATNGSMVLSRDGVALGKSPFPDFGGFTVPADEGVYTLQTSATRAVSWSALSTKVESAWTFKSAPAPEFGYQPLLTATVTGRFDELNQAPQFTLFGLRIAAGIQTGAAPSAVTRVALDYSSDDGVTWNKGFVRKVGDGWEAIVFNPRAEQSTGFVSVRVRAAAENGSTVDQTVIRAYGLAK